MVAKNEIKNFKMGQKRKINTYPFRAWESNKRDDIAYSRKKSTGRDAKEKIKWRRFRRVSHE
ncbi:MAG TPA: hypothetical protein DCZ41_06070 [Firmicutes bacterium]|nr:hypothetical protein [Bacillota bacterium]